MSGSHDFETCIGRSKGREGLQDGLPKYPSVSSVYCMDNHDTINRKETYVTLLNMPPPVGPIGGAQAVHSPGHHTIITACSLALTGRMVGYMSGPTLVPAWSRRFATRFADGPTVRDHSSGQHRLSFHHGAVRYHD